MMESKATENKNAGRAALPGSGATLKETLNNDR
jgi:hypothetical protein